ncbi:nucleoporin NDC1 [Entomortierella parvispora]|uniref:Nucleoporin NDC1 n=1 Tax=Entomortierella parvispora TaxID=205924 RepID=A0A9P3LZ30_9FUNG|nr:nucleoporin NDC1 [Entomortierella parvispora]
MSKRRDQRRLLHQLTYRLGSRKVLEERSKASMIFIVGFAYLSSLISQRADGGLFGVFRFYNYLFTGRTFVLTVAYAVAGLALVGLRNRNVQLNPRLSATYLHDLLSIFSDRWSWAVIGFYIFAFSTLHNLIMTGASSPVTNYNELVVYITVKGITQINERYILVRAFSLALGLAYGMGHLIQQKDWLMFSDVQLNMVDYVFTHYRKKVVKRSLLFSARFATAFWIIYNFFFGRLLVSMAMRFVAEDIQYHAPQYGPRWYSFGLAFRLFLTSLPITMFMESVHLVCQHFLTMRMNVTSSSVDPNACLVSGVKSSASNDVQEKLLKYHAFQELDQLAGHNADRRTEIFSDATCVPSAWKQISDSCVDALKAATVRLERVPISTVTQAGANKGSAETLNTTARRRLPPGHGGAFEENIFRPSKHDHFFDSLKGPSTEELLAQSRVEQDKTLANKDSDKRPNLSGSRDRLEILAFRWISKTARDLVFKHPELHKQMDSIPDADYLHTTDDFQLSVWASQILARLVSASYSEDQFGVVQQDISKVLETMLKLLVTLESFLLKKSRSKESASIAAHINAQDLVTLRNYSLQQVLKTSIYQIVVVFRDQLSDFKLAPAYADRLSHFIQMED